MNVAWHCPGPPEHGAHRHARHLATRLKAAGHIAEPWPQRRAHVTHVQFTDALFGPDIASAAQAFQTWRASVAGPVVTTLHDLPAGDDARAHRRRTGYRTVMEHSDAVVVSSQHERQLSLQVGAAQGLPVHVVPLPLPALAPPDPTAPSWSCRPSLGVLGFVYPGKGHDQAVELAEQHSLQVVALGSVSPGHEDLLRRYGSRVTVTGHLTDAELHRALREVTVPLSYNPAVSASASLMSWIAAGRRPLVDSGPYATEIATRWPQHVTPLSPDAVQAALAAPSSTWAGPPAEVDVVAAHLEAFAGAHPVTSVSVVIPYYNQPEQLLRTWEGLRRQGIPDLEVIVADDGSTVPPPTLGPRVLHVRQDDLGFRAAAARNLGARAASGEVVAFLDADTMPAPGYLTALVAATTDDVVTVGRRRHADLDGWSPSRTGAWLDGGAAPAELPEPRWLQDGYRETDDLRRANSDSFRFVISAVMALPAALLARLGGFDERYVGYGGEDWDLAYRAWNNGADLRHVPEAVAWHDGPEWALRVQDQEATSDKAAEERRLAELIPEPLLRRGRLNPALPDVLVTVPATAPSEVGESLRVQTHRDLGVSTSAWTADQLQRARVRISLTAVPLPPAAVATVVQHLCVPMPPSLTLTLGGQVVGSAEASRGLARSARPHVVLDLAG